MSTRIKSMLVEGKDDKHAIIHLMSAHGVVFGREEKTWPVKFEEFGTDTDDAGGIEKLKKDGYLSAKLKIPDLTVGIIVDADNDAVTRWTEVRVRCLPSFPNLPEKIAPGGLIINDPHGNTLGVWIMPNNGDRGMLETFLSALAPDPILMGWAKDATKQATAKGAQFSETHREKAEIHTFLAWQKEPGKPLGLAMKAKYFDTQSPQAQPFVAWFKKLFEL